MLICAPFTCLPLVSIKCSFIWVLLLRIHEVCKIHDFLDVFFTGSGPVDPPVLLNVNLRVMSIVWQQPIKRNRTITHYRMYWHGRLYFKPSGYQFQVEACTSKGCSKSPESQTVWTLPGTPKVFQAQSCFQTLQHLSLYLATPHQPQWLYWKLYKRETSQRERGN